MKTAKKTLNQVAPAELSAFAQMLRCFASMMQVHRVTVSSISLPPRVRRRTLEDVIAEPPKFPDLKEPKKRKAKSPVATAR